MYRASQMSHNCLQLCPGGKKRFVYRLVVNYTCCNTADTHNPLVYTVMDWFINGSIECRNRHFTPIYQITVLVHSPVMMKGLILQLIEWTQWEDLFECHPGSWLSRGIDQCRWGCPGHANNTRQTGHKQTAGNKPKPTQLQFHQATTMYYKRQHNNLWSPRLA